MIDDEPQSSELQTRQHDVTETRTGLLEDQVRFAVLSSTAIAVLCIEHLPPTTFEVEVAVMPEE
jgi:hypothetical protein